jgi:tRNA-2-methylthio-N6-dimethylallyladenosine synthase
VYDSERLAGLLSAQGYCRVEDIKSADLIILNTCSVRQRAEHKVYSFLGSLKEFKKDKPRLLIGVGGCVAQQEGKRLLEDIPHLDFVFGTGVLEKVPELLAEAAAGRRRALTPLHGAQVVPRSLLPLRPGLKALVTVMQGCDNFCAYCVVPYLRGRERSRPAEEVTQEAAALAGAGVKEVALLGQNVNSYHDPATGLDFPGLLAKVAEVSGILRIRFTTSHPKDLSPGLIEAMAGIPQVMEELHLPVQAGSDRVLKAMNRGYSRAQYLDKVAELKKRVPSVALGSDLIVGFPGESEEDFQQSLSILQAVRYDYLYSFKYSDRPFTKASRLAGKLPDAVKAERLGRLQALQRELSLALHRELVGQVEEVLVEGPAKKGEGLMTGRSRAGRAVNFPGPLDLAGSLVKVIIKEGRVNSLRGRLWPPAEGEEPWSA